MKCLDCNEEEECQLCGRCGPHCDCSKLTEKYKGETKMPKDLNQFIKGNMSFLSIQDGDTFTGEYQGYAITPDRFNPGKETVSYKFKDLETGKVIPWNKSSNKVAIQMSKFKEGDVLTIKRTGEGMGTTYKVALAAGQ